jgi:hypothetical protein
MYKASRLCAFQAGWIMVVQTQISQFRHTRLRASIFLKKNAQQLTDDGKHMYKRKYVNFLSQLA